MTKPSVANYRQNPLYARIAHATDDILRRGKVVMHVDVLVGMDLVNRKQLEDWRRGRTYLERVINCNLAGRIERGYAPGTFSPR